MNEPLFLLTATDALGAMAAGRLSAERLTASCLDRIESLDPRVRAWASLDRNYALAQAREVDRHFAQGKPPRKLSGIPVGVKDVFNTLVLPTEMGSPIRKGYKAGNDARAVAKLRLEGAIIPGKTVSAEFSVHTPGPTRNPHNLDHAPGTSSSGSVAAVASGMVPVALGTQTAGSVIRPASFCGVYGMKPSFGLIPRTGMLKTTDTLDHVGFCARSADDLALLLDVLRVRGPGHPVVEATLRDRSPGNGSWRIGLVKGPFWSETEKYARTALLDFAEALLRTAIRVTEINLPEDFKSAYRVHEVIYDSCLAYYFQEESEGCPDLLSERFLEMVRRGSRVTDSEYRAALEEQVALSQALDGLFDQYDILLTLASNGEAPKGEEPRTHYDTCLIWTLCGVPVMGVPAFSGPLGLPFGLQFVSRKYGDLTLLRFAKYLEQAGLIGPAAVAAEVR